MATTRLSLRRSRRTGVLLCASALMLGAAFAAGLWRESYWALALPVGLGVLMALGLSFSIGWTIFSAPRIPVQAEPYRGRGARLAALAICASTIVLGLAFLAGVLARSYWAVALPVGLAVSGLLAMVFQIGWAVLTQRSTLALKAERDRAREAAIQPRKPA
jgi:MFS family permease